jgi:hypothetical protein
MPTIWHFAEVTPEPLALAEENAGSSFVAMFLRNSEHFLDSFWAVSPGATFYNCSRVDIND